MHITWSVFHSTYTDFEIQKYVDKLHRDSKDYGFGWVEDQIRSAGKKCRMSDHEIEHVVGFLGMMEKMKRQNNHDREKRYWRLTLESFKDAVLENIRGWWHVTYNYYDTNAQPERMVQTREEFDSEEAMNRWLKSRKSHHGTDLGNFDFVSKGR